MSQVMGGAGDHLDVDIGVPELFCRVESAEPRSDDDDSVPTVRFRWGFGVGAHVCTAPDWAPFNARRSTTNDNEAVTQKPR